MKPDPIVAEVRAVRDRLAARFNNDVDAIVRHIQSVEAASGRTYVQPPQSSKGSDRYKFADFRNPQPHVR